MTIPVSAATWYVDRNASGNNSGTNWVNAWPALSAIDWTLVNPGDTVFISGGTSSKSYWPEGLTIGKSGTQNAPITIRLGQEAGHNGSALLRGMSWGASQWVIVNGAKPNAIAPTNVLQVENRDFIRSIGFWIGNTNGGGVYMNAPVGNQMLWCAVTNVVRGPSGPAHGLWGNVSQMIRTTNNVVRYNLISYPEDDGIAWIGNRPAQQHGEIEVAFNIIEYVGDDGMEANHGFSVHDNVIGPAIQKHGHPDGIQSVGSYWKIYNNKFYDFLNAFLRLQAVQTNHSDVLVFNNAFIAGVPQPKPYSPSLNTGIEIVQYANALGELPLMVWSNIVVANNTFYTTNSVMTGGLLGWFKRSETTPNAFVHNVVLTNIIVANNLAYVRNPQVEVGALLGVGWQPWKTESPWGSSPTFSSERDVVFDFNTATGPHVGARRLAFYGTLYNSGEEMASASIWKNNRSTTPVFLQEGINFDLASSDTAALNAGTNLSHLFNFDILNRPRNVGPWDRGAFESRGTGVPQPTGSFSLTSPASGTTAGSTIPTVTWSSFDSAISYVVEFDSETSFATPLIHSATVTGTSYTVPADLLNGGSTYYWRVRANHTGGTTLASNAPFTFLTPSNSSPPSAFALLTPSAGAAGVSIAPTLTWADSSGETEYRLEVASENSFATPLVYSTALSADTTSSSIPNGVLAYSTAYYWRVRALNASGETQPSTGFRSFTTVSKPASPLPSGESSTNGLLLWLTFDDDFSDSELTDNSGMGNHARRFGRPDSAYPTNWPTRVPVNETPGRTNATGYAGDFRWQSDGWGIYGRSGSYAAVTNVAPFRNLNTMTISLWARYKSAARINPANDFSADANACLVSGGTSTGIVGAWDFGRYNQNIWLNNTRFYILTNSASFAKHIVEFPDRGYDNNGDTAVYHHYALTFSNGVCRAYYDGQLYSTTVTHVPALTVAWNNNVAMPFLGIGCNTHGGSPALEDEPNGPDYPNHGWFNGVMDDVRIYSRALSASEISAIHSGASSSRPPAPFGLRIGQ